MKGHPEWIPVTDFFKHGLGNYLQTGGPLIDERRNFLLQFFDRLKRLDDVKSYSYYLDIVAERELEQVVRIFNLVNSQGTPLSKADLALSHICSIWPKARQTLQVFRQGADGKGGLKAQGFDFDLGFLVRCLSAVATDSAHFERLYDVSLEEIQAAWQRTRKALEYLLNVLRNDAYIDHDLALVSNLVLVPLVVFITKNSGRFANDYQKRDFMHWMYLALIWSRYSGSSEAALGQDLEALKASNPTEKLRENIIGQRGRIRVEGRDLLGASTRSAWSTMAYVVARAAGARDWFNGLPLYSKAIGKSNGLEYHHIFPQDVLYKMYYDSTNYVDRQKVNEIANIAYLTSGSNKQTGNRPPLQYLPEVLSRYPEALAQQSVPENPALWAVERFEEFLAARRNLLASAINNFLDSLIADRHPKLATIEEYIAAGESETVEFKGSLRWDIRLGEVNRALEKTIARTLAAFMNTKGGTLVVGVSDEGAVLGIEADMRTLRSKDRDGWEQHLRNVLNSYLSKENAALITVSFADVRDKTVAILRAEPHVRPVFLTDGPATEFYVRSGNTTQLLDVKQALAYVEQRFGQ